MTPEGSAELFPTGLFVTSRQKVEQIRREFEHEIHARQLSQMNARFAERNAPTELRVQLAAKFIKNPREIYDYISRLTDDGLKFLEWKDWPGTDVTFTCLSENATEVQIRDWFERHNGFFSAIELAVSKASVELREYLTRRFIQANPEQWIVSGKNISGVDGIPDDVVWEMIQTHGIVPKRFWWGLSNIRAAMFRGLEQERGTAILVSDDPDELNKAFSDVVGFMHSLRDRLFLDDELKNEFATMGAEVVSDVGNRVKPNAGSLACAPTHVEDVKSDPAPVAQKVVTYYQDASAAVSDWRDLIEQFTETYTLIGGLPTWEVDEDFVGEPYRYVASKSAGNLAGYCLADSIREFSRAVQRVGKYVPTGRSDRVDKVLLEEWATEVDFAFGMGVESEKLVGLMLRVNEAFKMFAEEVACDSAIESIKNVESGQKLSTAIGGSEPQPGDTADQKRKLSLNAHMTNLMEKHKEACRSWSVERWQLELTPTWGKTPSKGGIHGTAVWTWLMSLRGETQNALQEKQTAKDKDGKRRSTRY